MTPNRRLLLFVFVVTVAVALVPDVGVLALAVWMGLELLGLIFWALVRVSEHLRE